MMKVLITGATGMVGRNLVETVPEGIILLTPTRTEANLLDESSVKSYFSKHQPDLVIHCAGLVGGIQANISRPLDFFVQNLDMGRNVVLAAKACGIKKLLNFGSSCMYPRFAANPLREEQILQGELEPTNEGYALAKIATARLCDYISRQDNTFFYKTLIPCNLYGRFDKFDPSHSHMLPAVIRKIHLAKMAGEKDIEIWGDGLARREFMYAGDLAKMTWRCVQKIQNLPQYFNIGLGIDYSILEYYQAISEVIGHDSVYRHDLSKPIGMKQKLVDTTLMKNFSLQAEETLKSGIKKTYDFFLQECL